jgi:hypothetical protein
VSDHATPLGGSYSARFNPLYELFAAKPKLDEDLGTLLVVNIGGEMVLELAGS